ncbi:endonuclease domain-containing protein [Microlunatus sp. Y2014]|uniref:endonuclease domain-containing protein n=1 Tax=Microlunatus sp. Y2014 TaxID=3418488 RepID=UPI003DA76253
MLELLAHQKVIHAGRDPELAHVLQGMARRGEVRRVLPGAYALAAAATAIETRLTALRLVDPDAVVAGAGAAHLIGWKVSPDVVAAYRSGGTRVCPSGFTWLRGSVPPELIVTSGTIHRTCASLTTLDLLPTLGSVAVDEALRRGIPLEALHHALALTPNRPGNALRRSVLRDSRDLPWSPTERAGHQLLRRAGLTHWATNVTLTHGEFRATVDVVHRPSRTVIEFDGWEFHSSRAAFENDRWRDLQLAAARWHVIRVTWRQLVNHADEVTDLIMGLVRIRQSPRIRLQPPESGR